MLSLALIPIVIVPAAIMMQPSWASLFASIGMLAGLMLLRWVARWEGARKP